MKREPICAGVLLARSRKYGFCPKCERWGRVDGYGDPLKPHKGSRRCLRGELALLRAELARRRAQHARPAVIASGR